MEENLKDMTNDLYNLKATIREVVNKYNIKYLGIDIFEDENIKDRKDITVNIEI